MALGGSLDAVPVGDLLQFVHISGRTGTLVLRHASREGVVVFHNGRIVHARGPGTPTLGSLLVTQGHLGGRDLTALLERQRTQRAGQPLGQIALEADAVTREQLAEAIREQIRRAIVEMSAWEDGDFTFDQGAALPPDGIGLDLATDLLDGRNETTFFLLEAARVLDESRRGPAAPAVAQATVEVPRPAPKREATPAPARSKAASVVVGVGLGRDTLAAVRGLAASGHKVIGHVPHDDVARVLLGANRRLPSAAVAVWRARTTPDGLEAEEERILDAMRQQLPAWSIVALVPPNRLRATVALHRAGIHACLPATPGTAVTELTHALEPLVRHLWEERARDAAVQARELRAWLEAKRLAGEMHRAMARADVALELLRASSEMFDRGVLLLARGERLLGLGGYGNTRSKRPIAEALKGIEVTYKGGLVGEAMERGESRIGQATDLGLGERFLDITGPPANGRAAVIPVLGSARPFGLLYVDNGAARRAIRGLHAVELAASQAGLAFENALLRRRLETPSGEPG